MIHTALRNRWTRGGVVALLLGPVSCIHYANVERDRDRRPTMDTGVAATILYPGQAPPPLTGPPGSATTAAGAPGAAGSASSGGTSASGPVMIGGAHSDETKHTDYHSEPPWYHPIWFPFAVVLYPFRKVGEWMSAAGEAQETSAAPPPPPSRQDVQAAHERAEVEALRRQLDTQGGGSQPVSAVPAPGPALSSAGQPTSSIAAELAALRSRTGAAPSTPTAAGTESWRPAPPLPRPAAPPTGVADRVHDRNDDGRPDHWQYREGRQLVREVFDDDADGAPERTVFYDPASGKTLRVEEDLNRDGRVDSWAYYQDGRLVRRRADADGDGAIDHWTFHRDDTLLRDERDTNADGFRDRVDLYENGRLVRRDEDRNGDGRSDRITRFDASGAPAELEEDRDADGRVDVRSYYDGGRLVRRELLSELAAQEALSPLPRLDAPERPAESTR